MAVAQGYGKTVTSGSVFAYDVADTINSYIGAPTTNICTGDNYSIYNSGATNSRNQTFPLPFKPGYEVVKVVADTPGTYGQSILWTATYSSTPTTTTNSVYAWLESGTYVQVGQHWHPWNYGSPKYIEKGKWVRISETYAINEGGSYSQAAMVYSTDGVAYFCMPQYELKTYLTPFIGFLQTRSATQGLLPLVGNTSLDLTNVSFDSNAKITFDGTNDSMDITANLGTLSQYTIEYVAYKGAEGRMPIAGRTSNNFYKYGDYSWYYTHSGGTAEFYHSTSPSISGYLHCVITYDGANVRVWRNNNYAGAQGSTGTADFSNGFKVGYWVGGGGYAWNGDIPIVKIYNRALSAGEVRQNYLHYKTRFNLS